jgi:hypothetical protein
MEPDGQPLLGSMGLQPDMVDYFASRVQALTGGIGRRVQYVLRGRQAEVISSSPSLLQSHEDVDAALERLQSGLVQIPSLLLRVKWDGPANYAGEVPLWASQKQYQRQIVRRFARMLLLDLPFDPDACIHLVRGEFPIRVTDAAVMLGLSYGPASVPASDEPATVAGGDTRGIQLRLIAGEWLTRSLLADPVVLGHPALASTIELLATMRTFGGTMRERPFELLCADTLCVRSLVQPEAELRRLLPHLSGSARASDCVPKLKVCALPKAVSTVRRLDEEAKVELLRNRERWAGGPAIST